MKLEPCPFCGNVSVTMADSHVPKIRNRGQKVAIYCEGCFCEGPPCYTESDAVLSWNQRETTGGPRE